MPALRKSEKERLIKQTTANIEDHLANCHIELYLKQLHLQITRMKYSETFTEINSLHTWLKKAVIDPMREEIIESVGPIVQDLI